MTVSNELPQDVKFLGTAPKSQGLVTVNSDSAFVAVRRRGVHCDVGNLTAPLSARERSAGAISNLFAERTVGLDVHVMHRLKLSDA